MLAARSGTTELIEIFNLTCSNTIDTIAAMLLIAWLGPLLLFVWLMARRPTDRSVAAFAKTYEVPLTSHNVELLRRYIQWTRRWRLGGTVAVVLVAMLLVIVTESDGLGWIPLVVGYSLGSLFGELLRPVERVPGARPAASLERRRVRHFVVPWFVAAVIVVFVASLVPAVFLLLDNPRRAWVHAVDPAGQAIHRPQDWFVIVLTLASVGAAVLAWIGTRALARAPIPGDTADRLAVRHAIRSAAIMSLIGGSVMISGLVGAKLGNAAVMLDGDTPMVVQWTNALVAFLCFLATWWGGLMTLTTIPRLAPFTRNLPIVPHPDAAQGA
jgi:hypothetical protein